MLDGDPTSPKKGSQPPIFGSRLLWPNAGMDQDATWCEGGPVCYMGTQLTPPPKG